jgi:hypothetical protein
MKITANQQVIDKSIKVVETYAAKEGAGGSINNLSSILIHADQESNTVTLTAENELSATQYFIVDGADVEESGTILVPASRLKTAVSNVPVGEDVTLEADSKTLAISSGRRKLSLDLLDVHSTVLPRIGESGENKAVFESSEFVSGFKGGASIADNGSSSISSNVYLEFEGDRALFATRIGAAVNLKYVSIKSSDGSVATLVNRNALNNAIEQIAQGETVEISIADNKSAVHLVVEGENVKRHIRLATSAHDVKAFQIDNIRKNTFASVEKAISVVTVNKKDLIATFRSADTIAALNGKTEVRDIKMAVAQDGITLSVKDRAGFEDVVDIKSLVGEPASLLFRWNQFTNLFDSYPPEREEIIIALIPREGSVIRSIALIDDEDFTPGTDSSTLTYVAMAAATQNN